MVRPFSLIAPYYIYICMYNMLSSDFRLLPCALEVGLDEIDEVLLQ